MHSPKPIQPNISTNPDYHFTSKTPIRPTKSMNNKKLKERRAKRLCLLSDERFVPGHRCKNTTLHSLCLIDDEEDIKDEEIKEVKVIADNVLPIYLVRLQTIRSEKLNSLMNNPPSSS
jgi:hypothetical protein